MINAKKSNLYQMKAILLILIAIIFTSLIYIQVKAHNIYIEDQKEIKYLRLRLKQCDSAYTINYKLLDSVIEDNRRWHNHAVRMQYIVGVKNPDTIFTYKEKLKHPIVTKGSFKKKFVETK